MQGNEMFVQDVGVSKSLSISISNHHVYGSAELTHINMLSYDYLTICLRFQKKYFPICRLDLYNI